MPRLKTGKSRLPRDLPRIRGRETFPAGRRHGGVRSSLGAVDAAEDDEVTGVEARVAVAQEHADLRQACGERRPSPRDRDSSTGACRDGLEHDRPVGPARRPLGQTAARPRGRLRWWRLRRRGGRESASTTATTPPITATRSASSTAQTQSPGYHENRSRQKPDRAPIKPGPGSSRRPHSRQYS